MTRCANTGAISSGVGWRPERSSALMMGFTSFSTAFGGRASSTAGRAMRLHSQIARSEARLPRRPLPSLADLAEPGDAHRLCHLVNHRERQLVVLEVKRDCRLMCEAGARGRHLLDQ